MITAKELNQFKPEDREEAKTILEIAESEFAAEERKMLARLMAFLHGRGLLEAAYRALKQQTPEHK